jgi:hypothetical protein
VGLKKDEHLRPEVESSLAEMLRRELEAHKRFEKLRENVVLRHDFNPTMAFKVIDTKATRFLDFASIETFLAKYMHDHPFKLEEIVAAFVRRVDRDGDCKISYIEFMEAIMPVCSSSKRRPVYATPTSTYITNVQQRMRDAKDKSKPTFHKRTLKTGSGIESGPQAASSLVLAPSHTRKSTLRKKKTSQNAGGTNIQKQYTPRSSDATESQQTLGTRLFIID